MAQTDNRRERHLGLLPHQDAPPEPAEQRIFYVLGKSREIAKAIRPRLDCEPAGTQRLRFDTVEIERYADHSGRAEKHGAFMPDHQGLDRLVAADTAEQGVLNLLGPVPVELRPNDALDLAFDVDRGCNRNQPIGLAGTQLEMFPQRAIAVHVAEHRAFEARPEPALVRHAGAHEHAAGRLGNLATGIGHADPDIVR